MNRPPINEKRARGLLIALDYAAADLDVMSTDRDRNRAKEASMTAGIEYGMKLARWYLATIPTNPRHRSPTP